MTRGIRRLPSPALVISLIALVVVIGGGSYALAISDNAKDKKIAKKVANQQIKKKAPGLKVKHAKKASQAANADTVGGNHLGFAHITYSGATPQVDDSQSIAGVTVSPGVLVGTTCVHAPFTVHAVTGSVDVVTVSPPAGKASATLEASVVAVSGHACPVGSIEVVTHDNQSNKDVADAYYIMFS